MKTYSRIAILVIALMLSHSEDATLAQTASQVAARDRQIAATFAPIFYQALGDSPRHDYITNFDFDGDWRGNNNWENSANPRFPLKAYIYYSVSETETHFFIHYAAFHPRDYKGGGVRGKILSEVIREGVKHGGKYDPTGRAQEATLAHENDMEGCLVVVAKEGSDLQKAHVVFVETIAHNRFLKYATEGSSESSSTAESEKLSIDGQRVRLYIEPKGHGIRAYQEDEKDSSRKEILIYAFNGRADDPEKEHEGRVNYDLLPLSTTLWPRARRGTNETYGEEHNYGKATISFVQKNGRTVERQVNLGVNGSAFLGSEGGHNMARPPWGWFDDREREQPLGEWFFDPAKTIKRHFQLGENFSVAYLRQSF
ncbi:MAG: hypothetical protein WBP93_22465 [Pyrinomonadaceae bacterium]